MEIWTLILQGIVIIGFIVLGFLLKNFWPKYFEKKGENLATKEDIGEITKIVEEVKNKLALELELQKISYSGIHKEKINAYKEFLKKAYDFKTTLKNAIYPPIHEGIPTLAEVSGEFENFENFYKCNKFFYSENCLHYIEVLMKEYNQIRTDISNQHIKNDKEYPAAIIKEIEKNFFDAVYKLIEGKQFHLIEEAINVEIKKDLKLISG